MLNRSALSSPPKNLDPWILPTLRPLPSVTYFDFSMLLFHSLSFEIEFDN